MSNKPTLEAVNGKKFWRMPDGDLVRYIAGGSTTDNNQVETSGKNTNVSESNKEFESKLSEARNDAAKYRTKLRELEEKVAGINFEEYESLKKASKEADEKKALEKGEYEKLLSEKTSSLNEKISQLTKELEDSRKRYESKIIDDELSSVALANNAVNARDVKTIVKSEYEVKVEKDGAVRFYKGDSLATDGKGNPLSVGDVVSSVVSERPYLVKSASGGAGANGGKSNGSNKPLSSIERIKRGLQKI